MKISIRIFTVLTLLATSILVTPSASAWNDGASIAVSTFGGTYREEPRSIKVDENGNIYSSGYFRGTVDFDPSEGVTSLTSPLAAIYLLKLDPSGNFLWVKRFGGTIGGNSGNTIAFDGAGHLYLGGNFKGETDFDPGVGTAFLTPATGEDAFIVKLDLNGNYVWARSFGGVGGNANADGIGTIEIDGSGNVIANGLFTGEVDFDPGTGVTNLSSKTGTKSDFFILKLDSSGNFIWAKSIGTGGPPYGGTLALDSNGSVYAAGIFTGTVDFDPGDGTVPITAAKNTTDTFIVKLNSLGDYQWVNTYGGNDSNANEDWIFSVTSDADGNVYATGYFSGTVNFARPGDPANLTASGSSNDIFILKLNSSGEHIWSKKFGNSGSDGAWSITTDSSRNVYATGGFTGAVSFKEGINSITLTSSSNSQDTFILKLDSSGNCIWAKSIGGAGSAVGNSITLDRTGNAYIAGTFSNTVDFNPGAGTSDFTSNGDGDIFISKLDSSGNVPSVAVVSAGADNSKVATIPSGVTEAAIAKSTYLPAIKLNFGGTVPTAITVKPITNPAPSSATPFSTSNSPKIVDIVVDGTFSGSVTLCLDGGSADRLYHYKNSAWVELGSRSYVNGQVCGVTTSFSPFVAAPVAAPVYVAPTPVPYLRTLTTPKLNLKEGKLVCTPGTYNSGYTLDGVIQGSSTAIFSPSSYTYNLLINGVAQTSKVVTSASTSTSWELQAIPSGSLIACSVTVSANSLTNTDRSSDNAAAVSSALTTQSQAIKAAEAAYSETVSLNSKSYQKALVDNRATWRKEIETIQSNYSEALSRIKAKGGPKTSSETSAALKLRIAASKKSAADYAASKPAALAEKDAANKAALDAKTAAIAKANLNYGTFIESIGYGVLIP